MLLQYLKLPNQERISRPTVQKLQAVTVVSQTVAAGQLEHLLEMFTLVDVGSCWCRTPQDIAILTKFSNLLRSTR